MSSKPQSKEEEERKKKKPEKKKDTQMIRTAFKVRMTRGLRSGNI